MNKYFKIILIVLMLFKVELSNAQNKFTISGVVKSKKSGESIISASIKDLNTNSGTITNEYGFYSLTLTGSAYRLEISAIGKKTEFININVNKNEQLDINLEDYTKSLQEVSITATTNRRPISGTQMGVEKLSMKDIKNIPVLFGEKDVLKTIQLLPGIKSAGEGRSGFYVRGGSSDQNLILLDEATVYNASHLLGFFSTFNSDAIKDITVYKAGMPAQYGGRLSSVVDVKMNDGNNQNYDVSGGLGLISAKLNVEGPIQEDKSSFLISGRRTYADIFLKISPDTATKNSQLYFYDFNAKMNYQLSKKDRLYISGYFGKDKLGFSDQFGINWGNSTATARWNHIYNSKLFSNTSLIFSNYSYKLQIKSGSNDFNIFSQIQDWNLKQDYQWNVNNKNNIRLGWNSISHTVRPGEITASESSTLGNQTLQKRYSWENALYFSNTWKANNKINVTYGFRLTAFSILGKGNFFTLDRDGNVTDTLKFDKGEFVKTYINPEPRIAVGYQFNENSSIKTSYVRNVQNMHLISNSTSNTPTDKWVASTNIIKPEISDQVSLGYYKNIAGNKYEVTVEAYYKAMQNQIDYRDGADVFNNDAIESQLLFGKGRAYGAEWMIRKQTGKLTGWLSYTLSKTEKQIDGVNNNKWYNARQDRTHDIAIVGIYQLSKRWTVSANWVFYTGDAVSFPSGKYQINGQTVFYYTERNGYRMPSYHRLDIGATLQLKAKKKYTSELAFGLYNAYGRENAYSISFRDSEDNPNKTEALQTSLFRWIPSISYNFKF